MSYRLKIIEKLQNLIRIKKLEAFIVTNIHNVRYLTGFSGSSGFCLITPRDLFFFTDFRYTEQAEQEVLHWTLKTEIGRRIDLLSKEIGYLKVENIGFESSESYEFYEMLSKLPVKTIPCSGFVESLRIAKHKEELDHIKKAYNRAEEAFKQVKTTIKPGISEIDVALRLERALKRQGCRRIPFDIIVASGPNSSKPHASVSSRKIQKGDFVIIDWGGEYEGYFSDITRTLLMRDIDLQGKMEIYELVNKARENAINAVAIGRSAKQIDAAARDYINNKGYGENFGHGTGHGIGLQSHEAPWINKLSDSVISEGMIFTIEPGIYIRSLGGVRIEDTVAIVSGKAETLNKLPTDLEIVG